MKSKRTNLPKSVRNLSIFLLLLLFVTNVSHAQKDKQEIRPLPINKTIERSLKGGESHIYQIKLKKGQVLRIDAIEKEINISISISKSDVKKPLKTVNFGFGSDRELITLINKENGFYHINVQSSKSLLGGKYELKARLRNTVSHSDRERVKAEMLLANGFVDFNKQNEKGLNGAIESWQNSLPIWNRINESYWEGITNVLIGAVSNILGKRKQSLKFYNQALLIYKSSENKLGEAITLNSIGVVYATIGEKEKALKHYKKALPLFKELKDRTGEVAIIISIGLIYSTLSENLEALNYYKQALPILKSLGDKSGEATVLNNIGIVFYSYGEKRKALSYYQLALSIRKTLQDKRGLASTLNNIGGVHNALGEKNEALKFLNNALDIYKNIGDKSAEATTLINISAIYQSIDENQKALNLLNDALPILRKTGNKSVEAVTLNNIAVIYSLLGNKEMALDFNKQALSLRRFLKSKNGEAVTLNNIGTIYGEIGENQTALKYYYKSLKLRKLIKDKDGEASTLGNISTTYQKLGENRKALNYLEQALALSKTFKNKNIEVSTLIRLGLVYDSLKRFKKALDYYNQALNLSKDIGSKKNEASSLGNIGLVYNSLNEKEKALDYLNRALRLSQIIEDKEGEAIILGNIGFVYLSSDEQAKGIDYSIKSLPYKRAFSDRLGETRNLSNIMFAWGELERPGLAVFYGKQSVNIRQKLREYSKEIDDESQKSFLRTLKPTYTKLTELLIEEGESAQSIEVLNLYQDQQFFDFNRDSGSPVRQVSLSEREQKFANLYESSADTVGKISFQLDELKRQVGQRQATEEESDRTNDLETKLKSATDSFLKVLKDAEIEFAKKPADKDKVPDIKDVSEMQATLRELSFSTKQKTATLYTLIGEKNFYVLLMTGEGSVKVFSSAIEAGVLNKKLIQFYALLQTPAYDSRILGRELYDIIIPKELEKELEKQKIKTLMWSLDGNLRYIPVSALSPDGKKYLVEKYQNVVFTRANKQRMTKAVSPSWTGFGFGSSKEHKVKLLPDSKPIAFSALSGSKQELNSIFQIDKKDKAILSGEVLEDKDFTKKKFYEVLKQKRPLVHISSHFRFYPGDSSLSFLLLGDGQWISLNELKKQEKLFEGVELLTLSACATAAVIPNADGREIDGFAELAQRLGANAVMATLWQVTDYSTAELMTEFYKNKQERKQNKAEALQKAQLRLLRAKSGLEAVEVKKQVIRSDGKSYSIDNIEIEKKYRVRFKKDRKRPFTHPYYWSPFVLYGNWK